MRYVLILLLVLVSGCGSPAGSLATGVPVIVGHTDAELETVMRSRDAIRRALQENAKAQTRLVLENKALETQDRALAVEQTQTRFRIAAVTALFAGGVLFALSIYAGSFTLFGWVLGPILRGASYACAAICVLAFACDWLAPYAWYLGLLLPATAIGLLVYLLHRSHVAQKIMADSWHAAATELETHSPVARTRLDRESLIAQAKAGVKSHIDSVLHRI